VVAESELAEDIFVRDAFATGQRDTCAFEGISRLRRDLLVFHRRQREGALERLHHHF
jgi:hypothetical protein